MRHARYLALLLCLAAFCACGTTGETEDRSSGGSDLVDTLGSAALFPDPDSTFEAFEDRSAGDRENWQKPQMVISRLGDLSDKVVADIGAGTGYFTMRLARKAHKVIAIDIEQQFLDYISRRLDRTSDSEYLNVETRLTRADDPSLHPREADLVLLVNTYAFIDNRVAYFRKVLDGLRPDGRLVVVDFRKEPLPVGPPVEDKVSATQVALELDSAGFAIQHIDSLSLDYQYTVNATRR